MAVVFFGMIWLTAYRGWAKKNGATLLYSF